VTQHRSCRGQPSRQFTYK